MKQQTAFESPSSHVLRGGPSESGLVVRVSLRLATKRRCCYSSNKQLLGVTIACGGPGPGWIGRAWICPVSSFGTPRLDDGGLRGAAIPREAESRSAVQCHFAMDMARMRERIRSHRVQSTFGPIQNCSYSPQVELRGALYQIRQALAPRALYLVPCRYRVQVPRASAVLLRYVIFIGTTVFPGTPR